MIPIAVLFAAFILLLIVASTLSRAGQIKRSLRPFIRKTVRVTCWGTAPDESSFVIVSVIAIGPGLHIVLKRLPEGALAAIKVAQPTTASIAPTRIEIADARYIQWNRRNVAARVKTAPALVLEVQAI